MPSENPIQAHIAREDAEPLVIRTPGYRETLPQALCCARPCWNSGGNRIPMPRRTTANAGTEVASWYKPRYVRTRWLPFSTRRLAARSR